MIGKRSPTGSYESCDSVVGLDDSFDEKERIAKHLHTIHDYAKRCSTPTEEDDAHAASEAAPDDQKEPDQPPCKRRRSAFLSTRAKARREPLPMKLRALPASFWEQPNVNKGPSPGAMFSALPPLCIGVRLRSPATSGRPSVQTARGSQVSPANTELLFSLFRAVEQQQQEQQQQQQGARTQGVRRGRPRRNPLAGARVMRDDDPCLVSSVTEQLLATSRPSTCQPISASVVALGASRDGDGLQADSNYSQILSELVVKL